MTNWHRLFGLALTDLFTGTNYAVELEKDLSTQQQFLDVLIVQQSGEGLPSVPLPEGFDNLAKYNLLTYKSLQEPLNCWAIGELIGHYISYRKEVSPNLNQLLPEEDFRLYAVCTHYPAKLATQVTLQEVAAGIYELNCGCYHIRVLVTGQFPPSPENAFWQLFSAKASQVWYGRTHYQFKRQDLSLVLNQLFEYYDLEGIFMPYTVEQFVHDYTKEHLHTLTLDERLAGVAPDDVLRRFSPDDVLKCFSPDDVLRRFSPDQRLQGLSPDEVLKRLSPEQIEAYLSQLKGKLH